MNQIALVKKLELPSKDVLEKAIQKLGYDFKIISELKKLGDTDVISCEINNTKTEFQAELLEINEIITDFPELKESVNNFNFDCGISFVWGTDSAAGACIGLISIALIDLFGSVAFYADEQVFLSRDELLANTPFFLEALKK